MPSICKKWGSLCVLSLLCILFIPFEKQVPDWILSCCYRVALCVIFTRGVGKADFLQQDYKRLIRTSGLLCLFLYGHQRLTVFFLFVLFHPPQHQFSKGFAFAASPGEIKSSFWCITSISIAHAQFLNVCPTARLSLHLRFNRHYASRVSGQWGHKMHRIRFKERHQIWESRLLCLDYLTGQICWSNQLISNSQESHSLP